jgi:hypothetical protein
MTLVMTARLALPNSTLRDLILEIKSSTLLHSSIFVINNIFLGIKPQIHLFQKYSHKFPIYLYASFTFPWCFIIGYITDKS